VLNWNLSGLKQYLNAYMNYLGQKFSHLHFEMPDVIWDGNFTVELAKSKADLEAVFRLQHESYVSRGLMRPDSSGLRCTVFHFLPQTNHVVIKFKGKVVGSVTLIADSPLGIPADKFFTSEIDQSRKKGQKLVELSSFVVDRSFKSASKGLIHLLMKFSFNYVRRFMGATELIVTVHPTQIEMFCANWYFQQKSEVIKFHSSKSALTALMTHSLDRRNRRFFIRSFPSRDISKNAAMFIWKRDFRFQYPLRGAGQVVHPMMTPELLRYFFIEKTNLYEDLDLSTRQIFLEMYLQFFGESEIEKFLNMERELTLREFRLPVSARVAVKAESQFYFGRIRDLTSSGCFMELPYEIKNTEKFLNLSFKIGETEVRVNAKPLWRNTNQQLRYKHGYGIQFETPIENLQEEIKNWLPAKQNMMSDRLDLMKRARNL
jgi:hypothetical protein